MQNLSIKTHVLFLIAVLFSCTHEKQVDIEGTWTSKFELIDIQGDTLILKPWMDSLKFDYLDQKIILTEYLNKIYNHPVELPEFPYILGKITSKTKVFSTHQFLESKPGSFIKTRTLEYDKLPQKIQFSSGYWSSGFDMEVHQSGNIVLQEEGFCDNKSTYSFKLSEAEIFQLYYFISNIQFDKLKTHYVCEGCADANLYNFSFFYDQDTINTQIYGEFEHFSLEPFKIFIENETFRLSKDTTNFERIGRKSFYSRELERLHR